MGRIIDKMVEFQSIFYSFFGLTFYSIYKTQKAKRLKKDQMLEEKLDSLEDGVKALLHNKIYSNSQTHLIEGSISIEDLDDLTHLFSSYKALGGNGTGEAIYNKVLKLSNIKEKNE